MWCVVPGFFYLAWRFQDLSIIWRHILGLSSYCWTIFCCLILLHFIYPLSCDRMFPPLTIMNNAAINVSSSCLGMFEGIYLGLEFLCVFNLPEEWPDCFPFCLLTVRSTQLFLQKCFFFPIEAPWHCKSRITDAAFNKYSTSVWL